MARRALRNNNRCDKQFSYQVNDKFGGNPPTFEQRVLYIKKLISQPVSYLLYLCVENVSCELCTSKLKLRSPEFKK